MPEATIFWKYFNKLHWSICLNLDTRPHVWTGHRENWFFLQENALQEKKKRSLDFKLKFVVLVSWSWSRVHTRSKQVPKHGNGRLQNGQFLTPAKYQRWRWKVLVLWFPWLTGDGWMYVSCDFLAWKNYLKGYKCKLYCEVSWKFNFQFSQARPVENLINSLEVSLVLGALFGLDSLFHPDHIVVENVSEPCK